MIRSVRVGIGAMLAVILASVALISCQSGRDKDFTIELQHYGNDKGIGFFYPATQDVTLSGITPIYGLAYTDEGWLEEDKGVGKVTVEFGNKVMMDARTYVKDRYWVRTLDTSAFKNGPLTIKVTAYDKQGGLIGVATNRVMIDNKASAVEHRYFAAPEGKPDNKGTMDSPWDAQTGINRMAPGDVLFLRGGEYNTDLEIDHSGTAGKPLTIMNYPGESVELKGAGIDVAYRVEYVTVMGIDQSGLRSEDYGVDLAGGVKHIEFWDSSFNDNTYKYEEIKENESLEFGTGFHAPIAGDSPGNNRQYITVSHCEAKFNDVDGFQFSSIDHGRFQFLESAWNPNHKTADIFQYKHANGFVVKNSEAQHWGVPSEDNVYLFSYSHHNGQDGWDIRSPHASLFGVVTHDEAQAGHDYGGVGIKLWEHDYKIESSLIFRNNLIDGTGGGVLIDGDDVTIHNTLFHNTRFYAVYAAKGKHVSSANNIFDDYITDFTNGASSSNSIFFGAGKPSGGGKDNLREDPKFMDAQAGNFFLQADSPALTAGKREATAFVVDGIDYAQFDSLGRPRQNNLLEIGAYTRYDN